MKRDNERHFLIMKIQGQILERGCRIVILCKNVYFQFAVKFHNFRLLWNKKKLQYERKLIKLMLLECCRTAANDFQNFNCSWFIMIIAEPFLHFKHTNRLFFILTSSPENFNGFINVDISSQTRVLFAVTDSLESVLNLFWFTDVCFFGWKSSSYFSPNVVHWTLVYFQRQLLLLHWMDFSHVKTKTKYLKRFLIDPYRSFFSFINSYFKHIYLLIHLSVSFNLSPQTDLCMNFTYIWRKNRINKFYTKFEDIYSIVYFYDLWVYPIVSASVKKENRKRQTYSRHNCRGKCMPRIRTFMNIIAKCTTHILYMQHSCQKKGREFDCNRDIYRIIIKKFPSR